jgi:quercetin dioxygenase-like cupin family protein
VRRGAYPPVNFGGTRMREYLLMPSGEKRVQAILSEIEPGGSGAEPYSLPADVKFVFALAGQVHLDVAGEQVVPDQGAAFTFPASARHGFSARPGAEPGRVLWVFSPALPDAGDAPIP